MAQTSTVLFFTRITPTPRAIPAKIPGGFLLTTSGFFCASPFLLSSISISLSAKPFPSNLGVIPPQKYVYPDPNSEFAVTETQNFREELKKKLVKEKEAFGDELDAVVNVCAEIFSEFMHTEYGGPGTLLVEPFTYMMIVLKEKKVPGALLAARESLLWAQNYVDWDWEMRNSANP